MGGYTRLLHRWVGAHSKWVIEGTAHACTMHLPCLTCTGLHAASHPNLPARLHFVCLPALPLSPLQIECSGEADPFMDEIPTVVVKPLPAEYQKIAAVGWVGWVGWIGGHSLPSFQPLSRLLPTPSRAYPPPNC